MAKIEFIKKKRAWYKKWWGIVLIVLFSCVLTFLPFFFYELNAVIKEIKSGAFIDPAMFAAQAPYDMNELIDERSPYLGASDASIVIVEFGDFNCPYCLKATVPIKQVLTKYGDKVKYYWRNYPATKESSMEFAIGGVCANKQEKFWIYHDLMFARQGQISLGNFSEIAVQAGLDVDLFNKCRKSSLTLAQVKKDYYAAIDGDVMGTPTFFVNGFKMQGVISVDKWGSIIEQLLPMYEKNNRN